ncbi:MAG: adenylate/guanylate cyclase domain-containing protein [Ardenticatenales bacterium]|nr:adenylate/guanylate cyclase domain-containing protein [Ardenticatenales bacterium]
MTHFLLIDKLPDDPFERELAREILLSERLRVTILAVVFAFILLLYGVFAIFYQEQFASLGVHDLSFALRVLGGGFLYTLGVRYVFGRFLEAEREPPYLARYANAFIETSVPTLALLILSQQVGPTEALISPPAFFYYLFILLATLRLDPWLCLFTGTVAALEYAGVAWLSREAIMAAPVATLSTSRWIYIARSGLLLVAGIVAAFVSVQLKNRFIKYVRSMEERGKLLNVFGQHLSPAVVNKLLAQTADVESETRNVCVMFLDIRNFTSFSEEKSPAEVVAYLNMLFESMIESVNNHQGIINKFLGDGFMAVFGAPLPDDQKCRHAVAASLEIIEKVRILSAGGDVPPTRVGIGLHVGEAITGTVGSSVRKEYTVIGDVVNLASRIEQLNKQFGSQLLLSEEVWQELGEGAHKAVSLEPLLVRGRQSPVHLWKLA